VRSSPAAIPLPGDSGRSAGTTQSVTTDPPTVSHPCPAVLLRFPSGNCSLAARIGRGVRFDDGGGEVSLRYFQRDPLASRSAAWDGSCVGNPHVGDRMLSITRRTREAAAKLWPPFVARFQDVGLARNPLR
jgi:hypothetical protein